MTNLFVNCSFIFQREQHTAEMVMIKRLMNEDLKDTLQKEKKLVAMDPGMSYELSVCTLSKPKFSFLLISGAEIFRVHFVKCLSKWFEFHSPAYQMGNTYIYW